VRQRLKQFRRSITYSEAFTGFTASLARFVIQVYTSTLRVTYVFNDDFLALDRNRALFGFWHGRQFLLVQAFAPWHVALMTDLSWAGGIQTKILQKFGYPVVRGSSKRKGAKALLMIKRAIEQGHGAALALDGPSGPIYESKPGILFLAKKLGYPIIPVAASAHKSWILKGTWCNYMLPRPFSTCYVEMGKPLLPEELDSTADLDRIMMQYTKKADSVMRRPV